MLPSPKTKRVVISLSAQPGITLVPYLPIHVPTYHKWLSDPVLQEMTGSEPLSMAEEYEMCYSWQVDESKFTSIIVFDTFNPAISTTPTNNINFVNKMVGDVNMFLSFYDPSDYIDYESDDPSELSPPTQPTPLPKVLQGELEIMLADPTSRGKNVAYRSLRAFISHHLSTMPEILRLFVKIKDGNDSSMKLFKRLGFQFVRHLECFGETELDLFDFGRLGLGGDVEEFVAQEF
ncbi:hypothetical protein ScalyP_jg2170 [Parmales sp. scaly parma]|nr:hypothetical protein ScalyP_jg2170 [Parmales sp. scaly parma]